MEIKILSFNVNLLEDGFFMLMSTVSICFLFEDYWVERNYRNQNKFISWNNDYGRCEQRNILIFEMTVIDQSFSNKIGSIPHERMLQFISLLENTFERENL